MTAMFLFVTTAIVLFLVADIATYALSNDDRGSADDKSKMTAETQNRTQEAETAESRDNLITETHNLIDIQSNCRLPSSRLNISTTGDTAVLISVSYTADNVSEDVTPFSCWVYMSSPANTAMSLLRLDKNCRGRGFISVLDMQSDKRRSLCAFHWFVPGPDFTTSSSVANASITLTKVTFSYYVSLYVQVIPKTSDKELEVRYQSTTQGKNSHGACTSIRIVLMSMLTYVG